MNHRNGQHASYFTHSEKRAKGVSSFEKNLNVFKREKYYTSFFFSFFLNRRKGYMELRDEGGKVSIKHLSFVKRSY